MELFQHPSKHRSVRDVYKVPFIKLDSSAVFLFIYPEKEKKKREGKNLGASDKILKVCIF